MCSGRTHLLVNMTSLALLTPLAVQYAPESASLIAWASAGACFGSLFLTPDLDLKHSRPNRAWGPLRGIWGLYHRLCTHRRTSHIPVVGALGRLMYLACLFVLGRLSYEAVTAVLAGDALILPVVSLAEAGTWLRKSVQEASAFAQHHHWVGALFGGLVIADTLHLLADISCSSARRLLKLMTKL